MDIENDVKSIILTVAGLPDHPQNLSDSTSLADLGYNRIMGDDLAEELDKYVKRQKEDAGVASYEITIGMSAGACTALIKNKLR